ncbi:hypothetical protein M2128_001551 [Polynucleobacter sphagniphilus]|jgi:hypothetical protein|uniref:Uncharacterized protein n=1 Tax=Polynucleobacter sphagniphilus TaxID=1743169 RepID=A0AA43S5S6_9BURK|nr:hypothetical protein [Polynucleobacter sphagniphilus]MDH6155472.1 hypothetical protein [Polynucleobacter sphagniphilus]MDH6249559.1 hypothetical protein [Polynucleobacter sphagniphilus]MDH6302617.1 hypothetical protein [Polynucleobacter sphagniphilus]MDH6420337.1 hypothetical protein [Polynucleobacter sphagniphilus]
MALISLVAINSLWRNSMKKMIPIFLALSVFAITVYADQQKPIV